MLPAQYRLLDRKRIRAITRSGKRVQSRHIAIRWYGNRIGMPPRFTVVASLRIDKRAVERNRVQRMVRAVIAEMLPKIITPIDMVIIAQPGITQLTYKELKDEIVEVLVRGKLITSS